MIRLKAQGYRPRRTIKMALTCGEETNGAFNGAEDLAFHHHDLIDADFALNEGGGGHMTKDGKKLTNGVMAAEKTSQNFTLTTTNPGGHSSRPTPDNAIYELADALEKIQAYSFPIQQNEITRGQFAALGPLEGGEKGAAMTAFAQNPHDEHAIAVLRADPTYNAILHTTCVATLLSAGHATNALPQRATANVNCRIWPGVEPAVIQAELQKVIDDPKVAVTIPERRGPLAKPAPLSPQVMGPFAAVTEKHFPGVKVVPTMAAGATDGEFLGNAGIPTYGLSGMFGTGENMGVHGLNEHIAIASLMEGRDFLFDLVKAYAPQ
jgi:acetylornithine deacetylase/succinyl-diaminopimelate desuccinylase-like protein